MNEIGSFGRISHFSNLKSMHKYKILCLWKVELTVKSFSPHYFPIFVISSFRGNNSNRLFTAVRNSLTSMSEQMMIDLCINHFIRKLRSSALKLSLALQLGMNLHVDVTRIELEIVSRWRWHLLWLINLLDQ